MTDISKLPLYATDSQFLEALVAKRNQIQNNLKWEFEDSEDIGNKYLLCSHGVGQEFLQELHLAVYRGDAHQQCPLDRRVHKYQISSGSGCFWTCRVWTPKNRSRQDPTPEFAKPLTAMDREEILKLFDKRIAEMEERIRSKHEDNGN